VGNYEIAKESKDNVQKIIKEMVELDTLQPDKRSKIVVDDLTLKIDNLTSNINV